VPEPGPSLSDAEVARGLAAVHARLAALAADPQVADVATELREIRKHLAELAARNAEVRARLGHTLGLSPEGGGPPETA
jgi:uncharacterized membrane protein